MCVCGEGSWGKRSKQHRIWVFMFNVVEWCAKFRVGRNQETHSYRKKCSKARRICIRNIVSFFIFRVHNSIWIHTLNWGFHDRMNMAQQTDSGNFHYHRVMHIICFTIQVGEEKTRKEVWFGGTAYQPVLGKVETWANLHQVVDIRIALLSPHDSRQNALTMYRKNRHMLMDSRNQPASRWAANKGRFVPESWIRITINPCPLSVRELMLEHNPTAQQWRTEETL